MRTGHRCRSAWAWLLAAVVVAVAAGCGSSQPSGAAPPPAGSPPASSPGAASPETPGNPEQVAAAGLIEAADLAAESTIDDLQGIRFTDAGTAAARAALEGGATGDALWAATWVYATGGTDPEPLLGPLESGDASTRVTAAAGLVSLGRAEGFDVLVDALTSPDWMAGSHPPTMVSWFAAHTLARYTGADPGLDPSATPEAVAAAWSAWLEAHRDRLVFEPEAGTWSAG